MISLPSKTIILLYFLFLNFSSFSGVHVDHASRSNQSHVCVQICEPVDTCNGKTNPQPHEEETLLEHVLDSGGLCPKSLALKLSPSKSVHIEVLQALGGALLPCCALTRNVLLMKHDELAIHFLQTRAPPFSS